MPETIIIVAIAQNGVIGREGKLPWHLPSDLQHFKKTTLGYPLIMGRKTFDSIGKPLPGRDNIVLTRDKSRSFPGCITMHSLDDAFEYCTGEDKVFVIGGGDIFTLALPLTDTIIVTLLKRDVDGDVYFSDIDQKQFNEIERIEYNQEEPYSIIRYERVPA
ncbi:MAG: dihydrofolate reductase [Desulfobacterales bacterium]|nr:dihydrofolate reductase [Deltaproteobacteria bacterium]NNK94372.1 dihydrofolate reductase [Desulfobacterales bacterium]